MNERWEKVHTVSDYWDGPILGVADMGGVPHVYEKIFSEEVDEYIDRYRVMPIDQELYSWLMESWSIFVRWRAAFDRGKTPRETHPALPEDRDRYNFLRQAIGDREKPHPTQSRTSVRGSGGRVLTHPTYWGIGKFSGRTSLALRR